MIRHQSGKNGLEDASAVQLLAEDWISVKKTNSIAAAADDDDDRCVVLHNNHDCS